MSLQRNASQVVSPGRLARKPAIGWIAALLAGTVFGGPQGAVADALRDGFQAPPMESRPRVWWHWLNDDISEAGIKLDLDWMRRAGVGGVAIFNGSMPNNDGVVNPPVLYMSPAWRAAMRKAVAQAAAQNMEVAAPTSPGWSETGAPFVNPRDAMKKLVWTETLVHGGQRFDGVLPAPSDASGPFASVRADTTTMTGQHIDVPKFYSDSRVIAYRVPVGEHDLPLPEVSTARGETPAGPLFDGKLEKAIEIDRPGKAKPSWIQFNYPEPVTIRSLTAVLAPEAPTIYSSAQLPAHLEVSDDGVAFRRAAELTIGAFVQNTNSFAPVTGRSFRVVLEAPTGGPSIAALDIAPGALLLPGLPMTPPSKTIPVSEMALSAAARIERFEEKAGFASVPDYYAVATPDTLADLIVRPRDVVDLTSRMGPDGRLDWTPPEGDWRILRLGCSLTGHTNGPAAAEATGLEVDKLSAPRVRAYMKTYLDQMTDVVGEGAGRGLQATVSDSIEAGFSNWTDDILDQFRTRRGYDPTPYLPALTGRVVLSPAASDAFLYDFRRTLMDLLAEAHYGEVASAAKARGLTVYGEALESAGRPSLGDDLAMRRYTDVPMGAMWMYGEDQVPRRSVVGDLKGAASVAHVYGKRFVGAESLSSMFHEWAYSPRDLKHAVDMELLLGVNHFSIHDSVQQPLVGKPPGLTLWMFGQTFNRNESWAEQARPWTDYIARNSWVLSQGRYAAQVAYFYGEEAPVVTLAQDGGLKDLPTQYGFDYVDADALLSLFSVKGDAFVTPSGMRYRVLQLGGTSRRMTLAVLRRLRALVAAGGVVVGDRPSSSPSLADDPAEFSRLADELWAGGAETRVGAGRVIAGTPVETALAKLGVAPDQEVLSPTPAPLLFHHRLLADGDVWFVTNTRNEPCAAEVAFRVVGRSPELWDAETGTSRPLSYRIENGRTIVPLPLDGDGSALVVFRQPATATSRMIAPPTTQTLASVSGTWTVTFQPNRGAPAGAMTMAPGSWTNSDQPGIRYFSGTATYAKTVNLPPAAKGDRILLSLGEVDDIAEVAVNGRAVRTVWRAPYRVDISRAAHPGANRIQIKVTNLWVNRLIGDAQPGAAKVGWTVTPYYSPKGPLRPSGLLGPVTLLKERP